MKVPLGVFLQNPDFAINKILLEPIDLGHNLRIQAGTILHEKNTAELTPLQQLKRVIEQLIRRAQKNNDPADFNKATANIPRIRTPEFTDTLYLKEHDILCLNVALTDDLDYPDGVLMKRLISRYPHYYRPPGAFLPLSEVIEHVTHGESIYILTDLGIPDEDILLLHYGDILNKTLLTEIRSGIKRAQKLRREKEFEDIVSDGRIIAKTNIYSYRRKLLIRDGEEIPMSIRSSKEWAEIIEGNPNIPYRRSKNKSGVFIIDKDADITAFIKDFCKRNMLPFMGEALSTQSALSLMQECMPRLIFIGESAAAQHGELDIAAVEAAKDLDKGLLKPEVTILGLVPEQENGFTGQLNKLNIQFHYNKSDIRNNPEHVRQQLAQQMELFI